MKVLNLTLKKKWFDMIDSDEKKHEYREIKWYWVSRLFEVIKPFQKENHSVYYKDLSGMFHYCVGYFGNRLAAIKYLLNEGFIKEKDFDIVSANNGYQKDCPNTKWKHKYVSIGEGREDWGAEPGKQYFILEIGELIKP